MPRKLPYPKIGTVDKQECLLSDETIKSVFYTSLNEWQKLDLFISCCLSQTKLKLYVDPEEEQKVFGDMKTMFTDGATISIAMTFLREQATYDIEGNPFTSQEQARHHLMLRNIFTMGHEVHHILKKHAGKHGRGADIKNLNHRMHNYATDLTINEHLIALISSGGSSLSTNEQKILRAGDEDNIIKWAPIITSNVEDNPEKINISHGIYEEGIREMLDQKKIAHEGEISILSSEEVYQLLIKFLAEAKKEFLKEFSEMSQEEKEKAIEDAIKDALDGGGVSFDPTSTEAKSTDQERETITEISEMVSKALQQAKDLRSSDRRYSTSPGGMEVLAEASLRVKTDWTTMLRTCLRPGNRGGLNYKRPSRRFSHLQGPGKPIIPSKSKKKLLRTIIAVDTSGSMSVKDVNNCANNIYSYIKNQGTQFDTLTEIWSSDVELSKDYTLKKYDRFPKKLELQGNGGTSFRQAIEEFQRIEETEARHSDQFNFVYLTDSFGDAQNIEEYVKESTKQKMIWLVTSNITMEEARRYLPYGRIVLVNEEYQTPI